MAQGTTKSKQQVLSELLEQGMVLVALDARLPGVDVPDHLRGDHQLRLNLSYRFGLPIEVNEWGVHATLTFNGLPHACRLPWASVFLMVSHVSGKPVLFGESLPPEVAGTAETPDAAKATGPAPESLDQPRLSLISSPDEEPASPESAPRRGHLSLVTPAADAADGDEPPPDEPPPPRGGHLRLVK